MFWYPKEKDYETLDNNGVSLRDFLRSYDPGKYDHPAVTVDNLIFQRDGKDLKILLIKRGRHPAFGMVALPGGFIEMDETLEESAARELFEETGVSGIPLTQLGAYGEIGRDPRLRIISVAYMAVISKDIAPKAGDDAADAGFYTIHKKKYVNNLETIYELSFNSNNNSIYAKIAETGGKRRITDSMLASDHSMMILDGLERLGYIDNM